MSILGHILCVYFVQINIDVQFLLLIRSRNISSLLPTVPTGSKNPWLLFARAIESHGPILSPCGTQADPSD